ncbi:PEP-CTERM protein-sorting domain-containing protein [Methylomagnum ishizawai]|uniref:PEP-CTERM protein-sorting domain-containing protein n=1 Tax=Methylomagnum ishizawai TaxID=1760988 RepID=A0A1Y6D143_9GAMM|nr:hypothetical protein [Methylomagnum ishizawai]SMF96331.1 PEP-CTERM protein-sorting domain-containing protein [Methylomagnum ishizawai]
MKPIHHLGVGLIVLAASTLGTPAQALPVLFVSTGHTGAQTQTDINHTQHWTFSVSQNVTVGGGLFDMKRGPSSTADVSFAIFEGTYSPPASLDNALLQKDLTNTAFAQRFKAVLFQNTVTTLLAGHTYTGVLFSDALDAQNKGYFVKGGSASPLLFVNAKGKAVAGIEILPSIALPEAPPSRFASPASTDATLIPEPTLPALMALGLAGLAWATRRSQPAAHKT